MNALRELSKQGQSIWLDYIEEGFIQSGELKRLVQEDGVRGLTSNPTIFEKAIAGSAEYDDALRGILAKDPQINVGKLFEGLAIENIRAASDILRTVYDETEGADGFVSIEVSPGLAHDTVATISEAKRLRAEIDRCEVCQQRPANALHEIPRAGVRSYIVGNPACILGLCDPGCHQLMDSQEWPKAKQVALLRLRRPHHFDLAAVNRWLIGRVTVEEVREWERVIVEQRSE